MPSTILVVTVGGASAPIVSAIQAHQPEFVAFIGSKDQVGKPQSGSYMTVDGSGEPCDVRDEQKCPSCKARIVKRQSKPSIVSQAGLSPERYQVIQVEPDDLNDAYGAIRDLLADLRRRFPDAMLIGDYTGGTKTMSAALMLAVIERGDATPSLMVGQRSNLQRIDDGTEMATAVDTRSWRVQRSLDLAADLFDNYDYAAAQHSLEGVIRDIGLTPALRNTIQRRVQICRGFDAWDRFDHAEAHQLLQPFAKELGAHFTALLALSGKGKAVGYEHVFDLVHNAERRAKRGRYDDAVARLYRAVELLAQRRLEINFNQYTGDIDIAALPESVRERYAARRAGDGKVRLGLQDAYQLLSDLEDPLGTAFASVRSPLSNALATRNQSILAHGMTPLSAGLYSELRQQFEALLTTAASIRFGKRPPQFPSLTELTA